MQLTEEPFDEIRDLFPKPRGNVRWGHRRVVLDGILYVLQHGCPWRGLRACYGCCTVYNPDGEVLGGVGVLAALFERLRDRGLVASGTEDRDAR